MESASLYSKWFLNVGGKIAKKVFVVSNIQYIMICAHTAQYISFFFTYEKKKIISQKHAVLQQDLNVKKMEGKRGGVLK